jgi:hypothetical protein
MADEQHDDVAAALAILRDAGFPVERIRILPAAAPVGTGGGAAAGDDGPSFDRGALLSACLAILADGEAHAAKDIARDLRASFPGVSRKQVNSVLSVEGKGDVFYDRVTFTYSLSAPRSTVDR